MAQLYPFRALRYNPALVRVADVVTQPYDKITTEMQTRYYQASEYNLVRVILGRPEPSDNGTANVYTRAAAYVREWRAKNVLAMDELPAVFAYSQRFAVPGSTGETERRGFIALGKIYDYADGVVFRHEQTLSKPKSDRLNLLRATRTHFGQIFMLYTDPAQTVESMLFSSNALPDLEVTDEYGVSHRLRKIDDPNTINIVCTSMEDKRLIIADGHHRYETALNYRNECALHREHPPEPYQPGQSHPTFPEAAVMMTFVNMDSPGLLILPTHRVVFGLENLRSEDFARKCEPYFSVERIPHSDRNAVQRELAQAGEQTVFGAVFPDTTLVLRAKPDAVEQALSGISPRQRTLDIVRLHQLVLERVLEISPEAIRDQRNVRYLRSADEAINEVLGDSSKPANAAFLINPVRLDQMRDIAFAGDVMPQKSTDFYPKLLSGLAAYALE